VGSNLEVMEKEFIPYAEALALKELGFDEPCFAYYGEINGGEIMLFLKKNFDNQALYFLAPLYQQAFRWFREKYGLDSWVYKSRDYAYFYSILKDSRYLSPSIEFNSYEEAELECLRKLIEIVKEKFAQLKN
jgi:hypothetical protein